MSPSRAPRRPPPATPAGWSGRVFLGIGGALYLGPAADTGLHRHHAIQVTLGLDRPFRLRAAAGEPWRRYRSAVVASNRSHQLDGSGCELAILYLEPEIRGGVRIAPGAEGPGFVRLPAATRAAVLAALHAASRSVFDPGSARRLHREILRRLHIPARPPSAVDARIRQAVDSVRAGSDVPSVSALARRAGLSPRRFRELFSAQLGMSCRQYLLWLRLQAAIRAAARGATLTQAASAAGFADSAHLSRTFRRMFGIVPSSVHHSITLVR